MRVVLDLETEGQQIRGSMSAESGSGLRFVGWLHLASQLERLPAGGGSGSGSG